MPILHPRKILFCAAALIGLTGVSAAQDVQSGIAAWQAGDYARAVAEWRPLADAGNADAQFNVAQAYRLGRGVPQNLNLAEQWFERAARQKHEQAGASLGLLLFQNGRAREAMPWIQAAAMRGDPRAQYVFGTALFNGDVLRQDLPRAYAMMGAAAAQAFPQAQAQLTAMESQLTPADRERGRAIMAQLGGPAPTQIASAVQASEAPPIQARRPDPAPNAEPRRRPDAGVSYTPPPENRRGPRVIVAAPPRATTPPPRVEAPQPRVAAPAPAARPAPVVRPAPQVAAPGNWRVQLGAFSSEANARRQWSKVQTSVSALGSLQPAYTRSGALTRLRSGPFASRAAADRVCAAVRAAGQACIAVPQ
ncbi:MAG TPA: SPOR domain-containing protein [Allosphingosinicella sp.]|nr:SPOR domain-containing protein [Allosphingosinicella sp.]